jgi:hypothetical protein
MFRCEACEGVFGPGVASEKVPVERRQMTYPERLDVNHVPKKKKQPREDGKLGPADDPGGSGWEIVREAVVCRACADARRPPRTPVVEHRQVA